MAGKDLNDIGYEDFRRMALDPNLSANERIGFPDSYRDGFDSAIFEDICRKVTNLTDRNKQVLDIGPGCGGLANRIIDHCHSCGHSLSLVDSPEMLSQLPGDGVVKIAGFYPDCFDDLSEQEGKYDAIVCYSVFHYIFVEASFWRFIDYSIKLLAPGGQLLIGDIPNVSKRKRFFSSEAGVRFHQQFMNTSESPCVVRDCVEVDKIDDGVILGVIMRARAEGCDAYWLPQPSSLPMSNRREDVLIMKP